MKPYAEQLRRLDTIPGIDVITAWTLLAELGPDMSVFPDAEHCASWAGLCPGNRKSAGKRLSGRTRKANPSCGATCAKRLGRPAIRREPT